MTRDEKEMLARLLGGGYHFYGSGLGGIDRALARLLRRGQVVLVRTGSGTHRRTRVTLTASGRVEAARIAMGRQPPPRYVPRSQASNRKYRHSGLNGWKTDNYGYRVYG